MKKIYFFFTASAFLLLIYAFSCNDSEGYSLGDFRVSIATVHTTSPNSFFVQLDNGKKLFPAASDVRYFPKDEQRVFINYTILSNQQNEYSHYIKVNDIWNVLTKNVIELNAQNADSIGNDPIKINDIWIGGNYLNIDFSFNYGGERPHAINLVHNSLSSSPATTIDAIELEFRHNNYNSESLNLYEGFVCFDLKPYQTENADSIKFVVKVNGFDKEKKYDLVYRYNQAGLQNISKGTPVPVVSSNEYY